MTTKVRLDSIIKAQLTARKMNANQLCKELSIPQSVMSGWLNGVAPSAKNLPLIKKLAEYFDLPVSILLFNEKEGDENRPSILFSSTFKDGNTRYRLIIEKVNED